MLWPYNIRNFTEWKPHKPKKYGGTSPLSFGIDPETGELLSPVKPKRELSDAQRAALKATIAAQADIDASIVESSRRDNLTVEGMHLFARVDYFTHPEDLLSMFKTTRPVCGLHVNGTSVDYDLSEYLEQLIDFEDERAAKTGHSSSKRYMDAIILMVPKDLSHKRYAEFTDEYMALLPALYCKMPWFARSYTRNKGRFIIICFSERTFTVEPTEQHLYYKSDFYRSRLTGKRCTASDDNAVLAYKKGDVSSSITSQFSLTKTQHFHKSKGSFYAFVSDLKASLVSLFKSFGVYDSHPMLKRYKGDGFFNGRGRNIRRYNRMFAEVEAELLKWQDALKGTGLYDREAFHVLVSNLRNVQSNFTGTFHTETGHPIRYTVRFACPSESVDETIDLLKRKLVDMITGYVSKVFAIHNARLA